MNQKLAQQFFNVEFQKRLKSEIFPDEFLATGDWSSNWGFYRWKNATMLFESPVSLGMTIEEFRHLSHKKSSYTLFEVAQIANSLERKTPMQLQKVGATTIGIDEYLAIQEDVFKIAAKWQEIVKPIRESIDKKIMIMADNVGGQMKPSKLLKA